jgi:hypothetical protein
MRWIIAASFVLIGSGFYLASTGFRQWTVYSASHAAPEDLALRELLDRGPVGSPNVILKEFVVGDNVLAQPAEPPIKRAWVPAVPASGPVTQRQARLEKFGVLFYSEDVRNNAEFFKLLNQQKLKGLILNQLVPLTEQDRKALQDAYPEANIASALIIRVGREPAALEAYLALLGAGGLLVLLGLAAAWWGIRGAMTAE